MAYTALYREWRPKTFSDVVGQKHITTTLKNQIKTGRVAHAYLLCGTRGTGKTSTAKILAKAVNCLNIQDGEPCNECESCRKINSGLSIDFVELDAASYRGIDKIRDIIDEVQYPPREAKYKVYIIDEVHMLTKEAVNAFLKTLEEPPSRVMFILATTDPQMLPITILSRCQRFDFTRIKSQDIFERLRKIVKEQGILADDKSLNLIGRMSDGAMRDALSILDQAISMGNGKVEYEAVINMLGLVTNEYLLKLTDAVIEKDVEKSMKTVDDVVFSGKDVYNFIKDIINHLRNLMIVKVSKNPEDILDMSEENINSLREQAQRIRIEEIMRSIRILQEAEEQSKWSKQSRIYLELAIIKLCKIEYDTSKEVILARLNRLEEALRQGKITVTATEAAPAPSKVIRKQAAPDQKKIEDVKEVLTEEHRVSSNLNINSVKKSWRDVLEMIKARRHMVIYASLITGEVYSCSEGVIQIKFDDMYAFNKQRLEKEENRKIVEDIFSQALKEKVRIKYIVDQKQELEKSPEELLKETFGEELVEIIDE
ncbi:DNA polymerase III subunit gamma/tau [Clostridium sp. SYSU_GA19001]|uniref:DNA polymerase III subunit gamma/tau n=1 Tax=Clostridium caldaquaticum TaxID=2940653 RepID=UPI002076EC13|nr:DNA polymerase III subunit gamma/tau [Clostridium caldaquaticum]MCM8711368.1 DNA polymerase III subunit gamma/tau [Clostridium caldaquaticum]